VMVTRNVEDVIEETLKSAVGLWDELLVDDSGSSDDTVDIVRQFGGRIYHTAGRNLGERKQGLVDRAKGDWILVLDADERISHELFDELKHILYFDKTMHMLDFAKGAKSSENSYVAYAISYQNYVFGKPVYWGGEKYSKVRLFRRGCGRISPVPLHEEVIIKNHGIGELRGIIHHYSFRTPWQLFNKFTRYARTAADEKKRKGEALSFAKLFLYGPHMFWARFVLEKGYLDGWRGFMLALAFGYMEGLTYWIILL
ncbi:glycosyltransferase family 2 protein, partial [Candidatus Gottesmanbacteria bacterium]|nr:glycosyltransferase family 2 protein [Candidatus Gottesmanbacteria bacterium]